MRIAALLLAGAALAAPAAAQPVRAPAPAPAPAAAPVAAPASAAPPQITLTARQAANLRLGAFAVQHRALAKAARFSGEIGVAWYVGDGAVPAAPVLVSAQGADGTARQAGALWRWASVTKQVTAVLLMQEVANGTIDLDKPVSTYLPDFASVNARSLPVRQLLRHRSGLPNPDDTREGADGVASFYRTGTASGQDPLAFCAGTPKGPVGGEVSYNNCDYIVAGALLEAVTGTSWRQLVTQRLADPLQLKTLGSFPTAQSTAPGFVGGQPEPAYDLARYGAAGSLYGSVADLLRFDIALMKGDLLPAAQREELWDGQADQGFVALGQWAFSAPLKGCAGPVRIIERRGAIGGVQVRNFILPEQAIAMALFTDQGEFDFGEVWQGAGFSHDMLSLAACRQERA